MKKPFSMFIGKMGRHKNRKMKKKNWNFLYHYHSCPIIVLTACLSTAHRFTRFQHRLNIAFKSFLTEYPPYNVSQAHNRIQCIGMFLLLCVHWLCITLDHPAIMMRINSSRFDEPSKLTHTFPFYTFIEQKKYIGSYLDFAFSFPHSKFCWQNIFLFIFFEYTHSWVSKICLSIVVNWSPRKNDNNCELARSEYFFMYFESKPFTNTQIFC